MNSVENILSYAFSKWRTNYPLPVIFLLTVLNVYDIIFIQSIEISDYIIKVLESQ